MKSRLQGAFALPLFIAILTALPFLPVLRNGFVDWDDNSSLVFNPDYRGLGWTQLAWMFPNLSSLYRPVTWLSLEADYLFWGMNPGGYHFTSLLFHVGNAVLLYFVIARLMALAMSAEAGRVRFAAAVAALLWSVHPLRVEPVAWASSRENVVAGF